MSFWVHRSSTFNQSVDVPVKISPTNFFRTRHPSEILKSLTLSVFRCRYHGSLGSDGVFLVQPWAADFIHSIKGDLAAAHLETNLETRGSFSAGRLIPSLFDFPSFALLELSLLRATPVPDRRAFFSKPVFRPLISHPDSFSCHFRNLFLNFLARQLMWSDFRYQTH